MEVLIYQDPDNERVCRPVEVIQALATRGRFISYAPDEKGNCHDAAFGLLTDLASAGLLSEGWMIGQGFLNTEINRNVWHSWVEFDGWVLDFSNGDLQIFPMGLYYKTFNVRSSKRYTPQKAADMLKTKAGRKKLGLGK